MVLPIIVATQALAQPASDERAIVIVGHGLASSPGDAAYSVTVIDKNRINEAASGRVEDVLREVAGEQSFRRSDSRSSNATNQSITLRGMGGNASTRALLVLDGVPQADPFGGWISFPAFSTDRLSSVRVTRGGGSLWGPGALAGTVELESAGPGEASPVSGLLAYGSRDSIDARATLLAGDRRAFLSLGGAYTRGDGFIPIVAEDRGPIDRRAPYRQYSIAVRGVVTIGEAVELQANVSGFSDRRDRGTDNSDNGGDGIDASVRLVRRGRVGWSLLGYVQKREFTNQSAAIDPARTTATLTNDQYSVPSTGQGLRVEVVPLAGAFELHVGADLRVVDGETRELFQFVAGAATRERRAGGRSLSAGAFADLTLTRGPLTGNVSARIDRWSIGDGFLLQRTLAGATLTDLDYGDREGWQPTGRAGIAYRIGPLVSLRAAAYRGWRLPTLNELYRPFRAGTDLTAANSDLKPESSLGAEIGADLALDANWKAGVTLYTGRLDDAIANVTIAAGPIVAPEGFVADGGNYRRRQNLDHIGTRGVDLDVAGRFGAFDARVAYALVDATVRADGPGAVLDRLEPAQVPRHSGSMTIGWSGPRSIRASLTARGVSRQYEDDLNDRVLRGAVTLDGYLKVPLANRVSVEARAENLFDKRVEAVRSASDVIERATPQTFWLGFRIN